jgi:hypothetical protein
MIAPDSNASVVFFSAAAAHSSFVHDIVAFFDL